MTPLKHAHKMLCPVLSQGQWQTQATRRRSGERRTDQHRSVQPRCAPARPLRRKSAQTPRAMRRRGSGAAIDGGKFAAPGALWYFLAREKVHAARMATGVYGKSEGKWPGSFPAVRRWVLLFVAAVRAVSRIRGILERRQFLGAAARRSPTGRASAALHPARVTDP